VLVLESGLFGSFTALNFFHWFLFWELSLIPAFFLIKLWGGAARPGGYAVLCLHDGRLGGAAGGVSGGVSFDTGSMDFPHLTLLASTGELEADG
jgi:NADH-quinone oxidoreductase subunit M